MKNLPLHISKDEIVEVTIPQEKIDLITHLADENAIWVKITDGGFIINDKIIAEIVGIIKNINPYYVLWTDKKPSKIPYEGQDAPDGYELRCDIKMNVDGAVIGLSLSKTSTKAHLAQYLKFLQRSGLQANLVLTRIRSKAVSSPHGKFNVAVFDCIGSVDDMQRTAAARQEQDIIDVTATKAEVKQPTKPSESNPWA